MLSNSQDAVAQTAVRQILTVTAATFVLYVVEQMALELVARLAG